ncbi:hypothetical protein FOZ62_015764, partial [Perkinsus olseni]
QLLQIRNAAAAAASAVNQHGGGGSGGQQAPMQQYIMAKRGQMQPTSSTTTIGLQKQQRQKTALGKAPPSGGQRGQGSLGSAAGTSMPKVPSAAMHNLLQSMLNQQQAQQRAGAAVSNPQTAPAGPTQANNPAAAAAAAAMGRANLGNLHQLYQSLLTQFTHGSTTGMRRQGSLTPTGPSPSPPPPPPTASGGAGVASGTNAMPAIQNMLQNILANSRPQYSAAPTPKGPGLRAPQGSPTATTPSLQQQRSPYQQFYA